MSTVLPTCNAVPAAALSMGWCTTAASRCQAHQCFRADGCQLPPRSRLTREVAQQLPLAAVQRLGIVCSKAVGARVRLPAVRAKLLDASRVQLKLRGSRDTVMSRLATHPGQPLMRQTYLRQISHCPCAIALHCGPLLHLRELQPADAGHLGQLNDDPPAQNTNTEKFKWQIIREPAGRALGQTGGRVLSAARPGAVPEAPG